MSKRPEDSLADMIANLPEKTGKPYEEWVAIIRGAKPSKHGEIMLLLKGVHGVSHGYANQIALKYLRDAAGPPAAGADPVDEMYSGAKAGLRPIHDALVAKLGALGNDVDFAPKKGYVSVRRKKQFAVLQPSTASRLDVGINLKGVESTGRLEPSGSFNAMLSHRVRVSNLGDLDSELLEWLRRAYSEA